MKKRILACLLALVMLIGVLPVMALAEDYYVAVSAHDERAIIGSTGDEYDTLNEAMKYAASVDTIYAWQGNLLRLYCATDGIWHGSAKSLTFVGAGNGRDYLEYLVQVRRKDMGQMDNADYSFERREDCHIPEYDC